MNGVVGESNSIDDKLMELDNQLKSNITKLMFVSCPMDDKLDTCAFTHEKEFEDMILNSTTTMERINLLTKYLPHTQYMKYVVRGDFEGISEYMFNEKKCYHTPKYKKSSEAVINDDLFQSFNFQDFTYIKKDSSIELLPTNRLLVYNKAIDDGKINHLILDNVSLEKIRRKVKKGYIATAVRIIDVIQFIRSSFLLGWHLQADGDQTNATLTQASILTMAKELVNKDMIKAGDNFVDFGSSIGSFLWFLSENLRKLDSNYISLKLYGIEYSKNRHILGSYLTYEMLRKSRQEWNKLSSPLGHNVYLRLLSILDVAILPNQPTIAYMFDKAFYWTLCYHVVLVAIATPSIRCLICTKPSHSAKGKQGTAIKFGEIILKTGYFKLVHTISGLKMNGKASETAGVFHIYEKIKKVDTVISSHIKCWLSESNCSEQDVIEITKNWEKANKKNVPALEPFNTYEECCSYYKENENLDNLCDEDHLRLISNESKACLINEHFRCETNANCDHCSMRFIPNPEIQRYCVRNDKSINGDGLFASSYFEQGTIICQYMGQVTHCSSSDMKGKYMAMVQQGVYINANLSEKNCKYINHSCSPNAIIKKIYVGGSKMDQCSNEIELWVTATEDIDVESKITIHYGVHFLNFFKDKKCTCPQCRMKTHSTRSKRQSRRS